MDLLPYQDGSVVWLQARHRAILGSDPGLGKSAITIRAARHVTAGPVWVICPSSLKLNWEREILKWELASHAPHNIQIIKDANEKINPKSRWVIVSYDIAKKLTALAGTPLPSLVIFDEAHKLQGVSTQRTRALLYSFAKRIPWVWLVTGTPMPNHISNAWTLFAFCTYGRIGKYKDFIDRYCFVRLTPYGRKPYGHKNIEELKELVKPILHRDTIEEVGTEIPDYRETIVPLELTRDAMKLNALMSHERSKIAQALKEGREPKTSFSFSRVRRLLGLEKAKQAIEFVSNLMEQGLSVVVFTQHVELAKLFSGFCDVITGATPIPERDEIVNRFQSPGRQGAKGLVSTLGTLGVGVTLTAASHCVFVEHPWVPAELDQAMGRIRRIGQKNFCNYYHLVMGEIDEMVLGSLRAKRRTLDKFFEKGTSDTPETTEEIIWE